MFSATSLPRALLRRDAHFPWSPDAWSNTAFTLAGLPVHAVSAGMVLLPILVGLTDLGGFFGLLVLWVGLLATVGVFTALHRDRWSAMRGVDIPKPPAQSWFTRRRWTSETTWRQMGYHALAAPVLFLGALLVAGLWIVGVGLSLIYAWMWLVPLSSPVRDANWINRNALITAVGLIFICCAPWAADFVVRLDRRASELLGPDRAKELERKVEDLTEKRAGVVDAADAERRRIERDLHDGAQQRLVSLAMNLGLARATLTDLPEDARRVIDEAHREAKEAIADLKNLVRGLHPAVLEDRGLDAALSGIAARTPLPVHLTVELPTRAPATIEAVAYFVVAESLTNVAKHARASRADVTVVAERGVLRILVEDDGIGGADADAGTGLAGLAKRVASVDGAFRITSPGGGPTIITVELPCEP